MEIELRRIIGIHVILFKIILINNISNGNQYLHDV